MAICLKIVRIIYHDFQIQAPENQGCFKAIVVRANISQPIKVELVAVYWIALSLGGRIATNYLCTPNSS